jgi:energy-converting hydrogenase A subunit R
VKRIFITDCEGPISKNDNAYELTEKLVPKGNILFEIISIYDDIQAEIVKRPNYRAGDTLRLIVPFLRACGATNEIIREFSIKEIRLVSGSEDTLSFIRNLMPSYIVSTSYEHYIQSLCKVINFPFRNTYCTELDIDSYDFASYEIDTIKKWIHEIVKLTKPKIPIGAKSITDLTEVDQNTVNYLDEIFWTKMLDMTSGEIIKQIRPVGGTEKVDAVKDIIQKNSVDASKVIYFGDSITDLAPLRYVRENNGLAISFNGNEYAIKEAEIAVLSSNTLVTSIITIAFKKGGKELVNELVIDWSFEKIDEIISEQFKLRAKQVYGDRLPIVNMLSDSNLERLTKESCRFRKEVRGEALGGLG